MKILVFTTLFPNNNWPTHGVFIKERMSAVSRLEDCEVRVVAPVPYHPRLRVGWRWRYSQVAREELMNGIRVYHPRYLLVPKVGMAIHGLLMFLSILSFVKKLKNQFDFDLIDSHYVYPDGFAAVLLGILFNRPVVVSARGSDINRFSKCILIRRFIRFTLKRARKVIAVSHALKEALVRLGVPEEKIGVIPNGVYPSKFFPYSRTEARRRLGLEADRKIILSVGNLRAVKGFDRLIFAVKMLGKAPYHENLSLILVGDGKRRRKLEEIIKAERLESRVRLTGAVPHDELYLWYNAADIFCLASEREGWPNVILESMACGTPVVCTAVGGIPEIIKNEELGVLTGQDPALLAAGLREALHKKWDRKRIVHHARCFTWDSTAKSVCQILESVFKTKKMSSDHLLQNRVSTSA